MAILPLSSPSALSVDNSPNFFERIGSTVSDGWNVVTTQSYLLYTLITETFFRTISYFAPRIAQGLELAWGRVREIYHRITSDALERKIERLTADKLQLEQRVNGYIEENQLLTEENAQLKEHYASQIESIRALYQGNDSNNASLCISLEKFRGLLNSTEPEAQSSASLLASEQLITGQQQHLKSMIAKLQTETSEQNRSLQLNEILRVLDRFGEHFGKIIERLHLIKTLRTPLTDQNLEV